MPKDHPGWLADLQAGARPCCVLSPHLDDAVLSCGALLRSLVESTEINVVTAFSAATSPPYSRAARAFREGSSFSDARSLFSARRAEDTRVMRRLGVRYKHLGYADALYRKREAGGIVRAAGRILPEVMHRYPTYRHGIAKGRVAAGDRGLPRRIAKNLKDAGVLARDPVLLCPLGTGSHVDHVITRRIGEWHTGDVVYYSDFPYNLTTPDDEEFIASKNLTAYRWNDGVAEKVDLIREYETQVRDLFPQGIRTTAETYYSCDDRS